MRRLFTLLVPVVSVFVWTEVLARLWLYASPPGPRVVRLEEASPVAPDPDDPSWILVGEGLIMKGLQEVSPVLRLQRFRAVKPDGTLRVALFGGSSVYNLGVEAHDGWCDEVASGPVEVLNLGANARGSRGLLYLLEHMLPYDLDVVVLYSGHNEYVEQFMDLELAGADYGWWGALKTFQLFSELRHRAWLRRHDRQGASAAQDAEAPTVFEHGAEPGAARPTEAVLDVVERHRRDLVPGAEGFQERLLAAVEMAEAAGARVVIGTVPSNLWRPNLTPGPDRSVPDADERLRALYTAGRYEEGRAYAAELVAMGTRWQSSDLENRAIRAVAAQTGVVLADVERAVVDAEPHGVPGETLFADWCHLNTQGNHLLTQELAAGIREALRR